MQSCEFSRPGRRSDLSPLHEDRPWRKIEDDAEHLRLEDNIGRHTINEREASLEKNLACLCDTLRMKGLDRAS